MEVVGDAGDGSTAVRLAAELKPDVIVMDLSLSDGDALEYCGEILRRRAGTRIVIHADSVDREQLDLALAAGIRNCVLKDEPASELHAAIRRAMRGKIHFSQEVTATLVESYQEARAKGRFGGESPLSERESQILKLMANGSNTKEIADELGCSVKTVDYYRKRLMTKLGAHSVAGLIKYAIRRGLTTV